MSTDAAGKDWSAMQDFTDWLSFQHCESQHLLRPAQKSLCLLQWILFRMHGNRRTRNILITFGHKLATPQIICRQNGQEGGLLCC